MCPLGLFWALRSGLRPLSRRSAEEKVCCQSSRCLPNASAVASVQINGMKWLPTAHQAIFRQGGFSRRGGLLLE